MAQKTITLLLPYIDTALRQITPLSHQRLSCLVQSHRHHEERSLSEREIEIMDWVKMGKTNPEIADILEISSYTVKNHLHHIFKKLSVYNRVQAISRFEQNHG
jgi:transcriptional regulator EpsA